jgi:hypothetical protein
MVCLPALESSEDCRLRILVLDTDSDAVVSSAAEGRASRLVLRSSAAELVLIRLLPSAPIIVEEDEEDRVAGADGGGAEAFRRGRAGKGRSPRNR